MIEIIDLLQRKVNSLIFRVLLIIYSIIILEIFNNDLPYYIYVISIILFISLYIYLNKSPKLRLINDYIFISICVFGKNINNPFIILFYILPIINAINFSGTKKSHLLALISLTDYIFLSYYYNISNNITFDTSSYLPFLSIVILFIINWYTSLRIKVRRFREQIYDIVDQFYTDKKILRKPHKIYTKINETINNIIGNNLISNLYCFKYDPENKNSLQIINGSKFVWNFELKEPFISTIFSKRDYILDIELKINETDEPYNLVIKREVEGFTYIFVFTTTKTIPFYYLLIGLFRILMPSLSKMAAILLSEKRLSDIRIEELKKLSERSKYVTRATKAMHFIRNRLGPVKNLLAMLESKDNVTSLKKEDFESLINDERKRAKNEIDNIISRADYLLEKSNNPINFTSNEKISLEKTYSILNNILCIYFPDIKINIRKSVQHKSHRYYTSLNIEGFELFLSDWFNNVKKYYSIFFSIDFNIDNDNLSISFKNDYKSDNKDVDSLIKDLSSNNRKEIMRRTTHGLYQIKTALEEMNIHFTVKRETSNNKAPYLNLTINFKLDNYENNNF